MAFEGIRRRCRLLTGKIVLLSLLPVALFLLLLGLYLLPRVRGFVLETKKAGVRNVVELAMGILDNQEVEIKAGRRTREMAQQRAKELIGSMHFDGRNYLWIQAPGPVILYHPDASLVGKRTDSLEPRLAELFRGLDAAVGSSGSGYYAYEWPKPGGSERTSKVSCVQRFEPWGWILGAGVYVDDVDREVRHIFLA